MIILTIHQVLEAGREAYLEKRLSAQGPKPVCKYRDENGRPCIIGAALSDEDAHFLDAQDDGSITWLASEEPDDEGQRGHLALLKVDDLPSLELLQNLHDRWAQHEVIKTESGQSINPEAILALCLGATMNDKAY